MLFGIIAVGLVFVFWIGSTNEKEDESITQEIEFTSRKSEVKKIKECNEVLIQEGKEKERNQEKIKEIDPYELSEVERKRLLESLPINIRKAIYIDEYYMGGDISMIDSKLPISRTLDLTSDCLNSYKGSIEKFSYREATPKQRRAYIDWLFKLSNKPNGTENVIGLGNNFYAMMFIKGLERKIVYGHEKMAFKWMSYLQNAFYLNYIVTDEIVNAFLYYALSTGDLKYIKEYKASIVMGTYESQEKKVIFSVLSEKGVRELDLYLLARNPTVSPLLEETLGFELGEKARRKCLIMALEDTDYDQTLYNDVKIESKTCDRDEQIKGYEVECVLGNYSIGYRKVVIKPLSKDKHYARVVQNVLEKARAYMAEKKKGNPQISFVSDDAVRTGKLRFNELAKLSGQQFERIVYQVLVLNGYEKVSVIGASGDQGLDIIAHKGNIKIGFQCKRYINNVGNKAVQEAYSGRTYYACDKVIVVTTSDFTESAVELASKLKVELWNEEIFRGYWSEGLRIHKGSELV
ncbi:restriction endonuclease [Levilactobacillus wangkuiensis]|uniref:restriction endonuclease n=1 Tax=Levilactobacillus wangkuiensis TaxID=2799566 RepID=UPI001F26D4B2|nr:restriction endonuclease [Levilactobacillus wangkuiensis]